MLDKVYTSMYYMNHEKNKLSFKRITNQIIERLFQKNRTKNSRNN